MDTNELEQKISDIERRNEKVSLDNLSSIWQRLKIKILDSSDYVSGIFLVAIATKKIPGL